MTDFVAPSTRSNSATSSTCVVAQLTPGLAIYQSNCCCCRSILQKMLQADDLDSFDREEMGEELEEFKAQVSDQSGGSSCEILFPFCIRYCGQGQRNFVFRYTRKRSICV